MLRKPGRSRSPSSPEPEEDTAPATAAALGASVLLVEDDADLCRLLRILLAADKRLHVTGEASSAAAARAALEAAPADLVILDHGIEGPVTGSDLAPAIRELAPEAKIILFTAFDRGVVASGLAFVDAYLRKDAVATLVPLAHRLLGLEPVEARRVDPRR